MRKGILVWGLIIGILLTMTACSSPDKQATTTGSSQGSTTETVTPTNLELTLDELMKYNGKNGQPAYIAVDGIIYDVTNSPKWKNGEHNGFKAGNDLTNEIKNISPHGVKVLERLNKVGTIKTTP